MTNGDDKLGRQGQAATKEFFPHPYCVRQTVTDPGIELATPFDLE